MNQGSGGPDTTDNPVSVALFPIPEMVCFPGMVVPLHVFEPRYRAMIRDCTRDARMIGVCHTARQVSPSRPRQPLDVALRSNQATFEPRSVFSAGPCEVIDTSEDGRLLVEIRMRSRYRLLEELQSVPYRVVSAERVDDEQDDLQPQNIAELDRLQSRISGALISLVAGQDVEKALALEAIEWKLMTPAQFSYRIFDVLRLEADRMQSILEIRRPLERLKRIADALAEHLDPI